MVVIHVVTGSVKMYLVHMTLKWFIYCSDEHTSSSCISSALETTAVPFTVKCVVTPELYSTKHRVVGLACPSVLGRIGGACVVSFLTLYTFLFVQSIP